MSQRMLSCSTRLDGFFMMSESRHRPSATYCVLTCFSDDPWNQTAADNAEWLLRFKREVGMINDEGPKLPVTDSWALEQGGSGFAPPYAYPKGKVGQFSGNLQFSMRQGAKAISTDSQLANSFVENLTSRYPRPGTIFCSRELENGLSDMVEKHASLTGTLPSDEAMQARARDITKASDTAADDPVLLGKFKDWMREKLPMGAALAHQPVQTNATAPLLNLSDADVDKMLQNMEFDFDTQDIFAGTMEGLEDAGGVSLTGMGENQWSTF
jgi:hypothetical protein